MTPLLRIGPVGGNYVVMISYKQLSNSVQPQDFERILTKLRKVGVVNPTYLG